MAVQSQPLFHPEVMVETIPIAEPTDPIRAATAKTDQRLMEITARQQQTQRTLLDWLRVDYAIEKPGNKLQDAAELDSDTWPGEVSGIRGKKQPLTAAGVQASREESTPTTEPARARAAETLKLESALSDLVHQAYGLTPEEIVLMWQTARPRVPRTGAHGMQDGVNTP